MRSFRRAVTILIAVSTLTVAMAVPVAAKKPDAPAQPPANADPATLISSDVPEGMPEGGATVTTTTLSGAVTSVQSDTFYPGELSGEFAVIQSASGCNSVDAWKNMYTALGFLAYRWHQTKYRCWSGGKITTVSVGSYVSHSDGVNHYRGLLSSDAWYYSWNGNSRGGHYSIRQAKMENCIPIAGCWIVKYPFVKIWVTANGSYSYAVGE